MKVKVVRGNNLYWYSKRIGEIFYTDNCSPDFDGDYYIPDEGGYINPSDCEVVQESFHGLEEAYNQPVAVDYDKMYYTYPTTKATALKKSSEAIVADAFNQQHGTNLSEVDVVNIINALEALKKLET